MAVHDEPVHPGGLTFHFPKRAAARQVQLPPAAATNAAVKDDSEKRTTRDPAVSSIMRSMKNAAVSSGKTPAQLLQGMVRTIKVANEGATTTQVARGLDNDSEPWLDVDIHPYLLLRDLTRLYGKEWLSWEPETIWAEVEEDEELSQPVPRENRDKVMAIRTAVKTDFPWKRMEVFENVAQAFTGFVPRFDVMQPLEPYQVALAIDVLHRVHPGLDLDDDVLGYIAALLVEDGLSWAPPELFGPVEPMMAMLRRGTGKTAKAVEEQWKAGGTGGDDEAVSSQLSTLYAIKDYLEGMAEQLELTQPLPAQEYDAEADPTMPNLPEPGLTDAATGGR